MSKKIPENHPAVFCSTETITLLQQLHAAVFFYNEDGQLIEGFPGSDNSILQFVSKANSAHITSLFKFDQHQILENIPADGTAYHASCSAFIDGFEIKFDARLAWLRNPETAQRLLLQCVDNINNNNNSSSIIDAISRKPEYDELLEIIDHGTELIFKLDHEGRFIFFSNELSRGLGYTQESILGTHFSQVVHPDDLELCEKMYYVISVDRDPGNNIVVRIRHQQGHYIPFNCSATGIFNEQNELKYSIGFAQDVTEIQDLVNTLKATEERYNAFMNHSSEAIWRVETKQALPVTLDPEEMLQIIAKSAYLAECNDCTALQYGFETAAQMHGLPIYSFINLEDPVIKKLLLLFIASEFNVSNVESSMIEPNGNVRYFMNNLVGIVEDEHLTRVWCTQREITRQRQDEQKIRYLAGIMEYISDAVVSTDLESKVIAWNTAAEEIYKINAEDIVGQNLRRHIIHNYSGFTRDELIEHLDKHEHWTGESWFDRKDGNRIYLDVSISIVLNERGDRIGYVGIHRNITSIREAMEALRIGEERYRSLVDAMSEGIVLLDKNGVLVASNRSACEIFGRTSDELFGYPHRIAFHSFREDGTKYEISDHPGAVTLRTGESIKGVVMGIQNSDNRLYWISVNSEPVYYSENSETPDAVVVSIIDITAAKAAKFELEQREKQLTTYAGQLANILDSITDGFIAVDQDMNILLWNRIIEQVTLIPAETAIGKNISDIFPNLLESNEYQYYLNAIKEGQTYTSEHFNADLNIWFETSAYPSQTGLFIYFKDITERKEHERILSFEKDVLEINARSNTSLKSIVDYFLINLDRLFPGMKTSVLMVAEDDISIRILSAPNLSKEFTDSIEGTCIGPNNASWGNSMFLKKMVISSDIWSDPLWEDYLQLAKANGLRSCWSFPIVDSNNRLLATIDAYFNKPKSPQAKELALFERQSKLLGVIISKHQAEESVRISNDRYRLASKATNDALWEWDFSSNIFFWGEAFYSLFGFVPGKHVNRLEFWEKNIHPDHRERVVEGLNSFISQKNDHLWEDEYLFRTGSGKYVLVQDRGFLIFDQNGKVPRMVGAMQDITEKREMQEKILKQEVDKQKLIAKAVVHAQEQEREEIGKELHDNVNQILSTARLYLELAKNDEKGRMELIRRSTDNIFAAIEAIRGISKSLVPPSIGDIGLIESIQDLIETIHVTKQLEVEFYHQGDIDQVISQQQKLMIFRIIQEQVNNVLKHAEAEKLIIELMLGDQNLHLSISDNGKGFNKNNIKNKKGVGLSNIVSRTELFNGTVNMVTSPGSGCTLQIEVPISNL